MNFAGLGDDSITGLVGRGRSAFVFEREDTLLDVCDNCTRMRVSARPDSGREFNGSHDDLVPWNGEILGDQDLALNRRLLSGDRNERHACRKHGKPQRQRSANGDVSHRNPPPIELLTEKQSNTFWLSTLSQAELSRHRSTRARTH